MVPTEAGTTAYLENESDGGTHNGAIDPERNTRPRTNEPVGRTERYAQPEIGPKTRTRAKNRACSHMYKQATAKVQPDTGVPPKVGDGTEGRAAITEASDAGLNGERKSRLRGERRRRSDKRTEQHADKNQVHDSRPHGPQDRARRDRTAKPRTATRRDPGREPTQTRGQPDRDGNSTPKRATKGSPRRRFTRTLTKTRSTKSIAAGPALTPGAERLVRELEANAVTFDLDYIETFSVRMKYGQSMMNKGRPATSADLAPRSQRVPQREADLRCEIRPQHRVERRIQGR